MTARGSVFQLLSNDVELAGLGVQNTYGANSVDAPAEDLFLIIRFEDKQRAFGRRGAERMAVWAHDSSGGDYGRIDAVLERVKDLVESVVHHEGPDGWTLTTATWAQDGPDLVDDGYKTVTRWAEFAVVSRKN